MRFVETALREAILHVPKTKGATFYIGSAGLFCLNVFCDLRAFMTIKTFYRRPLLDKPGKCGTIRQHSRSNAVN
jgi:hypothetical protein